MGVCVKPASPSRAQSRDSGAAGRVLVVLVLILSLFRCCCPISFFPESHSSHLPHSKRVFATGSLLVAASEPLPATGVHARRSPTRLRPRLARGCESALRTALASHPPNPSARRVRA